MVVVWVILWRTCKLFLVCARVCVGVSYVLGLGPNWTHCTLFSILMKWHAAPLLVKKNRWERKFPIGPACLLWLW
uniref:Uncharacterized protein n=1 Tax=Setaria italica TaxID=4555 RepID=K3Z1K1_SETIT